MNRNIARVIVLLGMVAAALFGGTAKADAATGCMNRAEYRSIVFGQTLQQVERRAGTRGRLVATHTENWSYLADSQDANGNPTKVFIRDIRVDRVYSFRKCSGAGRVGVIFDNYSDTRTDAAGGRSKSYVTWAVWRNPASLFYWR